MNNKFDVSILNPLRHKLDNHPVYSAVHTADDLQLFMSNHVFLGWDFMSVVKYLQQEIAPATYPWAPRGNPSVRYFINQLVLEEESDQTPQDDTGNVGYASHFELYCKAMKEVGADPSVVQTFVAKVAKEGIEAAFALGIAPNASRRFLETTFGVLSSGKPHVVAAAFALGREHIIPGMFRAFLKRMGITEQDAPTFHFYLQRHIHLDGDFHGPISLLLLDELCDGDATRLQEAQDSACAAIEARLYFWDGILKALNEKGC
jgi:hypothetical protein